MEPFSSNKWSEEIRQASAMDTAKNGVADCAATDPPSPSNLQTGH